MLHPYDLGHLNLAAEPDLPKDVHRAELDAALGRARGPVDPKASAATGLQPGTRTET